MRSHVSLSHVGFENHHHSAEILGILRLRASGCCSSPTYSISLTGAPLFVTEKGDREIMCTCITGVFSLECMPRIIRWMTPAQRVQGRLYLAVKVVYGPSGIFLRKPRSAHNKKQRQAACCEKKKYCINPRNDVFATVSKSPSFWRKLGRFYTKMTAPARTVVAIINMEAK